MSRVRQARYMLLVFVLSWIALIPAPIKVLGANPLTLPPDFVDELAVGGLYIPYTWVWTPDGRMLIAERGSESTLDQNTASIRVFKNGALLATRAVSFPVQGNGERGFLGLALDPNFAVNGYLYTYYTRQRDSTTCNGTVPTGNQACNRVSRWQMIGDTISRNSEKVLVDNIPNYEGIHNAGDLHFGADGNLYISTGEGGFTPSFARNTSVLAGKILRIRPDPTVVSGYTIPIDNPFRTVPGSRVCGPLPLATGIGPCQEIFALGFRNPFRFTIKPGTSTPYVFDVGGGQWEEINEVKNGGDYGYSDVEGLCPSGQNCTGPIGIYTDPIFAYPHVSDPAHPGLTLPSAIIGGAFYTGSSYPSQYLNSLFYADVDLGWIHRLVPGNGNTWGDQPFATGDGGIIGVRTGPDTNLYYITPGDPTSNLPTGEIRRIRYAAGANQAPTAHISASPLSGPVSTNFTFSGSASTDPEASSLTYNWDFGDGSSQSTSSPTVNKTYATPGAKVVTLTVTDSGSPAQTSIPATIQVFPGNEPPTGQIVLTNNTDPTRTKFYAGDTWSFSATNLGDDQTPAQNIQVSWSVVFHHQSHTHPFLSGIQGQNGSATFLTSGEPDPVIWYRVIMALTDAQGQTVTIDRDIFPEITTVTLASELNGVALTVDANPVTSTTTLTRVVGFNMGITAPATQQVNGATLRYAGWNDGIIANPRVLVVQPGGRTYRVGYSAYPWDRYLPWIQRVPTP